MRTPVRLVGTFERRSEVSDRLQQPGDVALVERGRPRLLIVKCPCGCGEEYAVNLDREAGKAWRFYIRDGKLTLYPSVWRDSACQAHYIIRSNSAYVFSGRDVDEFAERSLSTHEIERVRQAVGAEWQHFASIAEAVDQIPWDTLDACRALVRKGLLAEGRGEQWGQFRAA